MKLKLQSPIKITEGEELDPKIRDILILLAGGSVLAAFMVFPGLTYALAPYRRRKWQEVHEKDWSKYNLWKLKRSLKRLREQKDVKVAAEAGILVVKLTRKGKRRALKYKIEELSLNSKNWDGKWRLIIYDIPRDKSPLRDTFRRFLKKLKLFKLQESVYLTPHECENEIDYLRELVGVGKYVQVLTVTGLENEAVYRKYFDL